MFDPSNYPRTYDHPASEKIAGAAMAVMGLALPTWALLIINDWQWKHYAMFGFFAAGCVTPLWPVLTQKIVLRLDRIEIHNGFTRRVILRTDIAQTFGGGHFSSGRAYIWLRLKRGKSVKLDTLRVMDDQFPDWFDGIPDEGDAPPVYPRTYTASRSDKVVALAVWAVGSGLLLVPLFVVPDCPFWIQIPFLIAAAAITAFPLEVFRRKLVLYAERLELRQMVSHHDIARHQIELIYGQAKLRLRNGHTVTLPELGNVDWFFQNWFEDIPYKHELFSSNPAFGRTPEERLKAVQSLARWTERLRWPALAVSLWAFTWPKPYDLCIYILMAIPTLTWLAVMLSRGRLGFVTHDDRVNFSRFFVGIPAMALAFRGVFDVGQRLADFTQPLTVIAAAAVILALLAQWAEGKATKGEFAGFLVVSVFLAAGSLLLLNSMLDTSRPQSVPLKIVAKEDGDKFPFLKLDPWETHDRSHGYVVSRKLYDMVKPGETICLPVYAGRFGWKYHYGPRLCPDDPRRPQKTT